MPRFVVGATAEGRVNSRCMPGKLSGCYVGAIRNSKGDSQSSATTGHPPTALLAHPLPRFPRCTELGSSFTGLWALSLPTPPGSGRPSSAALHRSTRMLRDGCLPATRRTSAHSRLPALPAGSRGSLTLHHSAWHTGAPLALVKMKKKCIN